MATEPTSPPTVTALPTAPSRSAPSTFRALMDAFLAALVTFGTQVSTLATWMQTTATQVFNNATEASNAATSASAAANYQGDYDAGTLYAIGESVSTTGSTSLFVKKTNAAAGTAPVDGTDWLEILRAYSSADLASQGQAEAGTDNETLMTPLRTAQAISSLASSMLAIIHDEKTTGTDAGSASATTWQTRTLNSVEYDPDSIVTLSSNTFSASRDCNVTWSAPAYGITSHKTRLVRVSDDATMAVGTSEKSSSVDETTSRSLGAATIQSGVAYRIEHYTFAAKTGNGLGDAVGGSEPEIYTQVILWG